MNKIILKINQKYPCRQNLCRTLCQLFGDEKNESLPDAIQLYGLSGTGKTAILREFLRLSNIKFAIIDCREQYSAKVLFESIINQLRNYKISEQDNYSPYAKCDTMEDFLKELSRLSVEEAYAICLENAERLRDMKANILPMFLRLPQLTGLNISSILESQIHFNKFHLKTGLPELITVHCPQYTKTEIQKILLKDFENTKKIVGKKVLQKPAERILNELEEDFYENFLNIFLNVFFRACRDLSELKTVCRYCFQIYCEPVLDGTIERNDVTKLWRHISKPLRIALSSLYVRFDFQEEILEKNYHSQYSIADQSLRTLAQNLELPYYAKYLLLAGFLASHNAQKEDKRLFVKHHGKHKKRLQSIKANAKTAEKMSTNLGPKSFTIDRLLAIFFSILEEKVGLTCNLLAQISSLVQLQFFSYVSGEGNIMEGTARLQCTVSLEFILNIGKMVGFNVRQYLCDFM